MVNEGVYSGNHHPLTIPICVICVLSTATIIATTTLTLAGTGRGQFDRYFARFRHSVDVLGEIMVLSLTTDCPCIRMSFVL